MPAQVQRGIFLLDIQRVEGDVFAFMFACMTIISELKVRAMLCRRVWVWCNAVWRGVMVCGEV